MNILFIDTCVWIKLLQEMKNEEIFQNLHKLTTEGTIRIIVSEQLLLEYERNKQRVAQSRIESLKSSIKKIRWFGNILDENQYKNLNICLDSYEENLGKISADYDKLSNLCDEIFNSENTIRLKTTDEILLKAANRAVNKQWPFMKNKNSIGDAIHYETVISFKESKQEDKLYFITDNFHDFSGKKAENPHPDIKDSFDQLNIDYILNFPKLIEELTNIPLSEDVKTSYHTFMGYQLILTNERPVKCTSCNSELNYQGYNVQHGLAGTRWTCPQCETIYIALDDSY